MLRSCEHVGVRFRWVPLVAGDYAGDRGRNRGGAHLRSVVRGPWTRAGDDREFEWARLQCRPVAVAPGAVFLLPACHSRSHLPIQEDRTRSVSDGPALRLVGAEVAATARARAIRGTRGVTNSVSLDAALEGRHPTDASRVWHPTLPILHLAHFSRHPRTPCLALPPGER